MAEGRKPLVDLARLRFGALVALLTATVVIFAVMHFVVVPRLTTVTAGLPIFDMRVLGYDRRDAVDLLRALGPEGRLDYLLVQLRLDDVFAPLYAVSLSLFLAEILVHAGMARRHALVLAVAIVLPTAAFDIAENAAIAEMLRRPPDAIADATVSAASFRTQLKWLFAALGLVAAAAGLVLANRRIDRKYEP